MTVTISSFSPTDGPTEGNQLVTIIGTEFYGTVAIQFGGIDATLINVINSTTVTCRTPAHIAGVVNLVLVAEGQTVTRSYTYTSSPSMYITYMQTADGSLLQSLPLTPSTEWVI